GLNRSAGFRPKLGDLRRVPADSRLDADQRHAELFYCAAFDLAHTFLRDAKARPECLQRRAFIAQSTLADDPEFPRVERFKRPPQPSRPAFGVDRIARHPARQWLVADSARLALRPTSD